MGETQCAKLTGAMPSSRSQTFLSWLGGDGLIDREDLDDVVLEVCSVSVHRLYHKPRIRGTNRAYKYAARRFLAKSRSPL